MSVSAAINALTTFFGFKKINFDYPRWHTEEWYNWDLLDTILRGLGATSVKGTWANTTTYVTGDRIIDTDGTVYQCAANHTSSNAPTTFAQERVAHPTYWTVVSTVIADVVGLQAALDSKVTGGAVGAFGAVLMAEANATQTKNDLGLHAVATSGNYADLINKPGLFDGTYASLSDKPTLFDGAYTSLSGRPALFDGTWNSLSGKPTFATVATTGAYSSLSGLPTIPTNNNQLANGNGYINSGYVSSLRQIDAGFIGAVFDDTTHDIGSPSGSFVRGFRYFASTGGGSSLLGWYNYYIQYFVVGVGWVTIG